MTTPIEDAYRYLWDVVGSSSCIPGLETCESVAPDTYRFVFQERSTGPISLVVCYTAHYSGNGTDEIRFEGIDAEGDNTDVNGRIRLTKKPEGATEIELRQVIAPETPVPRLVQGLIKSFVRQEAQQAIKDYLANVKSAIDAIQ